MRIIAIGILASILTGLSGCAAFNYPTYAEKQSAVYAAQAQAKSETAKALGKAAASEDARTRDMATLALLVMALTDKPLSIEAPREGLVERGAGALLSGLPYIGLARELGRAMRGHGGQQTNVNISGSQGVGVGTGGGAGSGSWSDRHDVNNSYNDDHSDNSANDDHSQ